MKIDEVLMFVKNIHRGCLSEKFLKYAEGCDGNGGVVIRRLCLAKNKSEQKN